MLSYYCLKCIKNTEKKKKTFQGQKTEELCFYQNVQCVIAKDRTLLKSKNLLNY